MKFMTGLRILIIGILMVSTAGCLQWADSNSYVANRQTPPVVGDFTVPDDGPSQFIEPEENLPPLEDQNPVPEPMTLLLLGPALVGLFALKRKKS